MSAFSSRYPHFIWPRALQALRNPAYRLFGTGQLVSLLGSWMAQMAEAWLVYRLTGSSLMLGAVALAGQIPAFLLAPLGGTVADRLKRHDVLLATQSFMMVIAFVLAAVTLTHVVQVWQIISLAALMGVVDAFDIPARHAFVADIVPRADVLNAIALNSCIFNGARMIGPALAGVVVAEVGEGWCFFVNGTSFIAVIVALSVMKISRSESAAHHGSPLQNIIEGFGFVIRSEPVRELMLLVGSVSFTVTSYTVLMPVFARDILSGGPGAMGILMGGVGLGALGGAIALTVVKDAQGLRRWIGIACIFFGVALNFFAWSRWLWFSVTALIPAGFFVMFQLASSNALVQNVVPDEFRGRAMAFYWMVVTGTALLGSMLAGGVVRLMGAPMTVALSGAVTILGGIVFSIRWSAHPWSKK